MKAVAAAAAAVAVALFLPLSFPAGEGQAQQQAAFEYEVLSGIRGDTRINDGWHDSTTGLTGGWEEGYALDLVPDYAVGKTPTNEPVHAAFRYGSGPALKIVAEPLVGRSCKGVLVDLYDAADNRLAIVEYVHVDQVGGANSNTRGNLTASNGALTSTHVANIAGSEKPTCDGRAGGQVYWTAPHLHQRVRVNGGADVDSTRDASLDGVGLSNRWVQGGIWLSPGSWVRERYFSETTSGFGTITDTGGDGVSHRSSCSDDARTGDPGVPEGHPVQVLEYGAGSCEDWLRVMSAPGRLCGGADRAYWNIWRGTEPPNWSPERLTTACTSYAPAPPAPPATPAPPTPPATVTPPTGGWSASATYSYTSGPLSQSWTGTGATRDAARFAAWTDGALQTVGWTADDQDDFNEITSSIECSESAEANPRDRWTCVFSITYEFAGSVSGEGIGSTQSAAEQDAIATAQANIPSYATSSAQTSLTSAQSSGT